MTVGTFGTDVALWSYNGHCDLGFYNEVSAPGHSAAMRLDTWGPRLRKGSLPT